MSETKIMAERSSLKALFVPVLFIITLLATSLSFFLGTVLLDIAATFNVSIGTASQLSIISNVMGIIMGFSMSAISIRFKHKTLLLLGNAFFAVGTLIYFLALDFTTVVLVSFLLGAGSSMMVIMVFTLIGEHLPLEKRGWAIGLVVSSIMTSGLIVSTVSGFIDTIAGWRMVLIWFLFPLSIACLVLGFVVVPSKKPGFLSEDKPSYRQVLKKIFLSRSPIACAISITLGAFLGVVPIYVASFFRLAFAVSPAIGGAILAAGTGGGIIGGMTGGKLINKFGRKKLAVIAISTCAVSNILITFMPIVELSVAFVISGGITMAMTIASLQSLALEQIPNCKSSMMSISNSFENIGGILALFVGGFALNFYNNNFQLLLTILGIAGLLAVPLLLIFVKDPSKSYTPK